jgi:hypothetical protein
MRAILSCVTTPGIVEAFDPQSLLKVGKDSANTPWHAYGVTQYATP